MKSNFPKKIHIIGSVGSGKTTLARDLSTKLSLPFYELDNVVWKRFKTGDIRRSDEERDNYLSKIINSEAWIVEGVHHKWVMESFENAELIIFLDTNYSKRTVRIIKRFILQKMLLEKANYNPTFEMFKKMFKWNSYFEKESKPEIVNILNKYNDKLIILNDNTEVEKYLG
ncbi:AAA family ATPase [Bacillus sp. RG28]|uniref:AAA family ATPase n=1 Tax=Gottfriedia endophytica TaxID=2820819 RepID=A0A940SKZ9_9BACI|nr:AAA family ATPase [Gottfriedia endophytica]MBP0725793.1 AAA family ATPase [Gottfriedia endophytica]